MCTFFLGICAVIWGCNYINTAAIHAKTVRKRNSRQGVQQATYLHLWKHQHLV